MDAWYFSYIVLPLMIFFARITDVTLGTMRIILIARGRRNIVPFLAFFEVLIWILAISRIFQNLDNPLCYLAFAAGFATGNYVGMLVEEKVALGTQLIRIITQKEATLLLRALREKGYGVTVVKAMGSNGPVHVIYSITGRKNIPEILEMINHFNPNAFYSIEDIRHAEKGIFPVPASAPVQPRLFRRGRKGK